MRDTASDPRWGWLGLARETSDWVFYFQYGSIVLTGLCMGFYWSYMLLLKQAILMCSCCSNGHISNPHLAHYDLSGVSGG